MNIENMPELLPSPTRFSERQYREIINLLLEERRKMLFKANLKETEMSDYYTLWAHQIKTPIAAMKLLLQNEKSPEAPELRNESDNSTELAGGIPAEKNYAEKNPASRSPSVENPADSYRSDLYPAGFSPAVPYALTKELFKIEQYVEMVLYYLRLDSMSSDFLFKQYELRNIVNQAVKKHALLFINSRLSFNIGEFSGKVVTDEKWLSFVIEQVISNALKYTVRGSISIDAETTPEKMILIIEDTGIGIRPEDLPRIFERGFTGYNGRLDKKSTGIGLYLCKQIIDKLSHTIEVTSEVGKGTKVCIGFLSETYTGL